MRFWLKACSGLSLVTAFLMTFICYRRSQLDYEETGQYFDVQANVTYSEQAVFIYGMLAIFFFITALFLRVDR